jgi:hypothetical protein
VVVGYVSAFTRKDFVFYTLGSSRRAPFSRFSFFVRSIFSFSDIFSFSHQSFSKAFFSRVLRGSRGTIWTRLPAVRVLLGAFESDFSPGNAGDRTLGGGVFFK